MVPIIDPEVYKIKDDRVQAVQNGRLSLQAFVYSLQSKDWFIFLKDTVYALTQAQYYALCTPAQEPEPMTKTVFIELLSELSWATAEQRVVLQNIKNTYTTCSACQYKRYMNDVKDIALKHQQVALKYKLISNTQPLKPYPETTSPVQPKVTTKILNKVFSVVKFARRPCFECVAKHIGQAYFEYHETIMGYPEHFMLIISNLAQAYEQCPDDASILKSTLMFCIGKSEKQHRAFVPVSSLLRMLDYYIGKYDTSDIANTKNQPSEDMKLELTDQDKYDLKDVLPANIKITVIATVKTLLKKVYAADIDQNKVLKTEWAGGMANLSDYLADYCLPVASMIRNRRLLFKELPSACQNTQYDCSDILKCLE